MKKIFYVVILTPFFLHGQYYYFIYNFKSVDCETLKSRWKEKYSKDFYVAWEDGRELFGEDCNTGAGTIAEVLWILENLKFDASEGVTPNFYNIVKEANIVQFYECDHELFYPGKCGYVDPDKIRPNGLYYEPITRGIFMCPEFFKQNILQRALDLVRISRSMTGDIKQDEIDFSCGKTNPDIEDLKCEKVLYDRPDKYGGPLNAAVYFLYMVAYKQTSNILDKELAKEYLDYFLRFYFYEPLTEKQCAKYHFKK